MEPIQFKRVDYYAISDSVEDIAQMTPQQVILLDKMITDGKNVDVEDPEYAGHPNECISNNLWFDVCYC